MEATWTAEWDGPIARWTAKIIKDNLWRFDPVVDKFEDILQEAKLLFWTLTKKYPLVRTPAHFFAIYKTSLMRKFVDKTRLCQKRDIGPLIPLDDYEPEGHLPNCGYLAVLLEELPEELKIVLGDLTTGRVRLRVDASTSTKRMRENANMRVKRRHPMSLVDPVGDLQRVLKYNS